MQLTHGYKQYETDYTHEEYAGGMQIQRKLVDDDLYGIIKKKPKALATALARTQEKNAANIFNNAFSTATFTGGDDLSLCNDSHTVTSSSTTYDNKGTLSLSAENIETVKQAMMNFVDDRGNVIVIEPDTILIPPELYEAGYEIVKTPEGLNSAEGNANVHYGRYKLVVWHYLTDTNNWFFLDSGLMKQSLNWFNKAAPEFAMEKNFDTIDHSTVVYKENYMLETPKASDANKEKNTEDIMDNQQERPSLDWIAGFIDGEGNLSLYKHNQQKVYVPRLIITNTHKDTVLLISTTLKEYGIGNYIRTTKKRSPKHKTRYDICVVGMKRMNKLLNLITHKLFLKRKQAEIIRDFINYRLLVGKGKHYDEKEASYREALTKEINSGRNPQRLHVFPS